MSQHPPFATCRRHIGISLFLLALVASCVGPLSMARASWSDGNWTEVFASTAEIQNLAVSSDGAGGTLAMILDAGPFPSRARGSRLSRTGTEVWGDGGIMVPFELNTTNQLRPVAIAPDGSGGAYMLWQEWHTVSGLFRLARFDAAGIFQWAVAIASAGSDPGEAGARIVSEPGVGVTVGLVNSTSQRLYAYRYAEDGTPLWNTDVNTFYHHNILVAPTGGMTEFDMQPDGQGGVLFAWYRYDLAAYNTNGLYFEQIGAQRIDSNGNRLWGPDGHQVWQQPGFWHVNAFHARIVHDGAGGAYVVTSGGLRAYGQHLNAAGTETWAANGIVLQATDTATWDTDTDPRICPDGAGGLILVQKRSHIYATRIDIFGSPLWGVPGIIAASVSGVTEDYSGPAIDYDEFGGAVVGWQRWDNGAESVGGLRLDAFGNVLWSNENLFSASGTDEIRDVHVVADGVGGAQYVWKRHVPDPPRKDDVYALGVNGQGLPPDPALYGFTPDAGEPGESVATLLVGEYLDTSYNYEIRRGGAVIPLTAPSAAGSAFIGGWLDLTGAEMGAWDLYATLGGTTRASLADAFGVGLRPGCTFEMAETRYQTVESFGTPRKMHFASNGEAHFAYLLYDGFSNEQRIYGVARDDAGSGTGLIESFSGSPISDLAFTVDSLDRSNYVYIRNGNELVSHTYDLISSGIIPSRTYDMAYSAPLRRPVVVPMANGLTRIVVELDNYGVTELWEAWEEGLGPNSNQVPQTGTNARDVDLATTADGLVMVYQRDTWLPGVSEFCVQHLRNGVWEAPVVLTFALSLQSPTVTSDRSGGVLVAWILDNSGNGSAPLLQTCLISNGVTGPVRTRATDGLIYRVQVDAQGPGHYFMMTQETGQPMQMYVRGGDGNVFYPRQRVNTTDDSDWPSFAAQFGGLRIAAMWQAYNTPSSGNSLTSWFCTSAVMTAAPQDTPTIVSSKMRVSPNPFNPRTRIQFELSSSQWVKVAIFDARGRRVRMLHNAILPTGPQTLEFDGRDDGGASLASGVYFAQLRPSLDAPEVVKLTLLK